jgi:methylthioribose-1-phosphate isomerase
MVLQAIVYDPAPEPSATGSSLKILDQLALPHRTTYIEVVNCEDAHAAIKQMKVRGAPAIAIVAALALAVEVRQRSRIGNTKEAKTATGAERKDDYAQYIKSRLAYLMTSRPTAVNLGDAVRKLSKVVDNAARASTATETTIMHAYIQAAERMLIDDVSDNKAIGDHGALWIVAHTSAGSKRSADKTSELKILTHCNTGSLATAGYGTALGVIRSLRTADMLTQAYCSETRPYNQGSRLTAYELVHDNIPATLITDSMAASLLSREGDALAAIVVGADRVAANGDTANKIGTYSLAVLAKHHGVKFLVAAPRTTIDLHTASGREIVIEERAPEEVTRIRGPVVTAEGDVLVDDNPESVTISTAATGINVWNPAFDVTPAALIDGVITELGVVEKNEEGVFNFAPLFDQQYENGTS